MARKATVPKKAVVHEHLDYFTVKDAITEVAGWMDSSGCEAADKMTERFEVFCHGDEIGQAHLGQLKDVLSLAEKWWNWVGGGAFVWMDNNAIRMIEVIRTLKKAVFEREKKKEKPPMTVRFLKDFTKIQYSMGPIKEVIMRRTWRRKIFIELYRNWQAGNELRPWMELVKQLGIREAEADPHRLFRDKYDSKKTDVFRDLIQVREVPAARGVEVCVRLHDMYYYEADE